MSDCCSTDPAGGGQDSRARCPANGVEYGRVPIRTILHHIKSPWTWQAPEGRFYFCDDPDCEVVYFGHSGAIIERSALRTAVGAKSSSADAMVCYCFGITRTDIAHEPATRSFVIAQTRRRICDCEVRNPAGRCCLGDFPKSTS